MNLPVYLLHRLGRPLAGLLLAAAVAAPSAWAAGPLTESYAAATVEGNATSGVYDAQDTYTIGAVNWEANLLPVKAVYLQTMSLGDFDVLKAAFPIANGRTYQSSVNALSAGSLIVRTYDVIGTPAKVGAALHVEYAPAGTDPTTNIHWIQVVSNNHKLGEVHGTADFKVDNLSGATPYYDILGAANSRNFYDFPFRTDGGEAHSWSAELLLVQGPTDGKGNILFLGGLSWGWENHALAAVPEPQAAVLMLIGLALLAAVGARRHQASWRRRAPSSSSARPAASNTGVAGSGTADGKAQFTPLADWML
jgi:hypothetical protein